MYRIVHVYRIIFTNGVVNGGVRILFIFKTNNLIIIIIIITVNIFLDIKYQL